MSITLYNPNDTQQTAPPPTGQELNYSAHGMVVQAAPSGPTRSGGGFLRSLAKLTIFAGCIGVAISGFKHHVYTPWGMMGAAEADFIEALQDQQAEQGKRQQEAKNEADWRNEVNGPLAEASGKAKVGCVIGQRLTIAARSQNSPWTDFLGAVTDGMCDVARAGDQVYGVK